MLLLSQGQLSGTEGRLMRIGLLGPTTVSFDDAMPVAVTAAKQRVVLAALALRAGRLVTPDEQVPRRAARGGGAARPG
jgi:hypothetical protein